VDCLRVPGLLVGTRVGSRHGRRRRPGAQRRHGSGPEEFRAGDDGPVLRSIASGQPALRRLRLVAAALADPNGTQRSLSTRCAVMLAGRASLEQPVLDARAHAYERWDENGYPTRLEDDAIPLAVRIALVARDADLAVCSATTGESECARAARAYDPAVVDAFQRVGSDVLSELAGRRQWETRWQASLLRVATVEPAALDAVLTAFADSPISSRLGSEAIPTGSPRSRRRRARARRLRVR
jgi:hypothetical protein